MQLERFIVLVGLIVKNFYKFAIGEVENRDFLSVLPLRMAFKRIKIPVQPSSEELQSLLPASLQLSIIIVNYKSQDYLIRCLYSLKKNLKNVSHEVIVVDNESDEEILGYFRKDFSETYFATASISFDDNKPS